MRNIDFLNNYQHLQYEIMSNYLIDLEFAMVALGKTYNSPVFNLAQIENKPTEEQLKVLEEVFKQYKKKSSIYFENSNSEDIAQFLIDNGYKKHWEDCWMFHDGNNINDGKFGSVKKVEKEEDLEEFLSTFNVCYQKDDPQNPYGELGDYIDTAKKAWERHHKSGKIEYFTILKKEKPVAVSTLTNFAGIGYISNVGSLRDVRGEGYGKIASLYSVKKSFENGNKVVALATEEGDYPNEFYKRIGFVPKFTAIGYVKKL